MLRKNADSFTLITSKHLHLLHDLPRSLSRTALPHSGRAHWAAPSEPASAPSAASCVRPSAATCAAWIASVEIKICLSVSFSAGIFTPKYFMYQISIFRIFRDVQIPLQCDPGSTGLDLKMILPDSIFGIWLGNLLIRKGRNLIILTSYS